MYICTCLAERWGYSPGYKCFLLLSLREIVNKLPVRKILFCLMCKLENEKFSSDQRRLFFNPVLQSYEVNVSWTAISFSL